jgi:hypothetical protein
VRIGEGAKIVSEQGFSGGSTSGMLRRPGAPGIGGIPHRRCGGAPMAPGPLCATLHG